MERSSFKFAARVSVTFANHLSGGAVHNADFSNEMFLAALISAAQEVQPRGPDAMTTLTRTAGTVTDSVSTLPQAVRIDFSPIPLIASVPEFHQDAQV